MGGGERCIAGLSSNCCRPSGAAISQPQRGSFMMAPMDMIKVLIVFGTRPEAIKLAPVVSGLSRMSAEISTKVCVTGQQRELLLPVLEQCRIQPHWDLGVMVPDQSPLEVTTAVLGALKPILDAEHPDLVLVQGDTTTAFAAALSAFYSRIPIGHVEAGLRSGDKDRPYPEEANRVLVDALADLHFAPTEEARRNLLHQGIDGRRIWVTGNTVVDALHGMMERGRLRGIALPRQVVLEGRRLLLVTAHRRESFGAPLRNICRALRKIVDRHPDVAIVFPVHLNPHVFRPVHRFLGGVDRVHLIEPLAYLPFVKLMSRTHLLLTDSGGIQEEAPSLGVPVLVMREKTERPEAIEAGMATLVGTEEEGIYREAARLLSDEAAYRSMTRKPNPYGDGRAAERIVRAICDAFGIHER